MDHSLENLLTTKEASELSGYTSDYLARLIRSGEINGKRVGHSWLLNRDSLRSFLEKKKIKNAERARELATKRSEEYKKYRDNPVLLVKKFREGKRRSSVEIGGVSLRTHMFAGSFAVALVVLSACSARSELFSQAVQTLSAGAGSAADGFQMAFGGMPRRLLPNLRDGALAYVQDAYHRQLSDLGYMASPSLSQFVPRETDFAKYHAPRFLGAQTMPEAPREVLGHMQESLFATYTFLIDPSHLAAAYIGLGRAVYGAIVALEDRQLKYAMSLGESALSIGIDARDLLARLPRVVTRINLVLGEVIIDSAHLAIAADVTLAYGLAHTAPEAAQITFSSLHTLGTGLAYGTERLVVGGVAASRHVVILPVTIARKMTETIVNTEYRVAFRFVEGLDLISGRYLAFVEGAGRGLADGITSIPSFFTMTISVASAGSNTFTLTPGW